MKVTYRGVSYDTLEYKKQAVIKSDSTKCYRGIEYKTEEVTK